MLASLLAATAAWPASWAATPATAGAAAAAQAATPAGQTLLRTELFFERVDTTAWADFLDKEVTPRFPDGLTWLDVNGQWRGPSGGPEPMPSRLLIVLHADSPHNEQALQDIARQFHARFGTHVLVASQPVRARDADWTEQRIQGNPQLSPKPD